MTIPQIVAVACVVGVLVFLAFVLNALRKQESKLSRIQAEPLPIEPEQPKPLFPPWYDIHLEAELIVESAWEKKE